MKKTLLGAVTALAMTAVFMTSCNTTKQTETDMDTAETPTTTETPVITDSTNMNNNNMGTDSIRAVE